MAKNGFTLIELSIVLVIIGLIVGGVLVGRDLIHAAEIRKQVSDIEHFDTAINAFFLKYNELPGDLTPAKAIAFGFHSRTGALGCGDGDRRIASLFTNEGSFTDGSDEGLAGSCYTAGGDESQLLWQDLQTAGFLAAGLTNGDASVEPLETILPKGVDESFVVAANGDMQLDVGAPPFGYTLIGYQNGAAQIDSYHGAPTTFKPLRISTAYAIDTKMDDGAPTTGKVYTLSQLPSFGSNPQRAIDGTCSKGSPAYYDVAHDGTRKCVIKIRGAIPGN